MAIPKRIQGFLLSVAMIVPLVGVPATAASANSQSQQSEASVTAAADASTYKGVVINEAYLSGGSQGAAYKNKFVELYNTTDKDVTLDGTSLQYRAASGTGSTSSAAELTGTIKAKGYYLIAIDGNKTGDGANLPNPDINIAGKVNPGGAKGGTLLLVNGTKKINPGTQNISGNADLIDSLGYNNGSGHTNAWEGSGAATGGTGNSDHGSIQRTPNGTDTNDNTKDFTFSATMTPCISSSRCFGFRH